MDTDRGSDVLLDMRRKYESRVSFVSPKGTAQQLVLAADPRRVWVRFYSQAGGPTVRMVVPNNPTLALVGVGDVSAPIEAKVKDAPLTCMGDWWGNGAAAVGWLVVEELYIGD